LTDIRFRLATAADAPVVQSLLAELARHDGADMQGSAAALIRHGFGARPLFHAILAERGTEALGLALYYPDYSTLRGRPGVYVQDLYVTETARGLGLGSRLLAQVMAVQDWDAGYILLMVDRENAAARRFYARQGFVDRGDYELLLLEGAGLDALTGA
jgi:ribosomal protein S18 acetylase RimI-like enzyme